MNKIRLRNNLLYLLAFVITYYVRKIISLIIDSVFNFNAPYIFLFMMTFGEIIGGATIYRYHISNWRKKKEVKYFGMRLIYNKTKHNYPDGIFKRILLIFLASFFDFYEFIIIVFNVPKIADISPTIDLRLGCITTISSALICIYAFTFKIGKHHKCSLISLGVCLFITLIYELVFKPSYIPFGRFIFAHFLVIIYLISITFTDCVERYLAYYNFIDPFFILMMEGIFGFFMSLIYSINGDIFNELLKQYDENTTANFVLLIFLLFLYLILSVIMNAYKVYWNTVYTPMARSIANYFLNPFFNIYYFVAKDDFQGNYFYFFSSEIISIIMDVLCCIFNEYIIIHFFGLEHDTKDAIDFRSNELDINYMDDDREEKNNEEELVETNRFK